MAQIGTVKVQTASGPVELPVFETADAGSNVYDMVRVQTGTGVGFVPFVATGDAALPYLRVQTQNNGVLAAHNEATLASAMDATVTLNGGTAVAYVYEDTDNDGLAENSEIVQLSDGTNSYNLGSFELVAGNDYWITLQLDNDVVDDTVEVSSISVNI